MKFTHYSVIDFVQDEGFQRWVNAPDANSDQFWEKWLAQHPDQREKVEQARFILRAIDFEKTSPAAIDRAGMLKKIYAGIEATHAPTITKNSLLHSGVRPFWRFWSKVAAVLVGLLLLGAAYGLYQSNRTFTYSTDFGHSRTIALPDGSVVTLNAHSSLRLPARWDEDHIREVWLEGEAFFKVRKKRESSLTRSALPSAKFLVHSRDLTIEVLGTEFNVNNRRGNTQVVLTTGKISLYRGEEVGAPNLVMQPSEWVEYSPVSQKMVKKKVNPEVYSSWVDNKLIFRETPLREIAQVLEDNYGLQVTFSNGQLADRKFTGSVAADKVDLLLTAIATSFNLKVIRTNNQVQFTHP